METSQALELLIARAKKRTGETKDSHLARSLGLAQDNYISMWRAQIRDGRQGPAFVNIVPLLEAAGVFSEQDAAREEAATVRERAAASEAEAKTTERDQQSNGRRRHPGEARG
jgi:hypothetical protein